MKTSIKPSSSTSHTVSWDRYEQYIHHSYIEDALKYLAKSEEDVKHRGILRGKISLPLSLDLLVQNITALVEVPATRKPDITTKKIKPVTSLNEAEFGEVVTLPHMHHTKTPLEPKSIVTRTLSPGSVNLANFLKQVAEALQTMPDYIYSATNK